MNTYNGRVEATYLFPVKGMQGIKTSTMGLQTDLLRGIQGDRMHAIGQKPGMTVNNWRPKGMFHVAMNTPGIARHLDIDEGVLEEDFSLPSKVLKELFAASGTEPDATSEIHVDLQDEYNLQDSKYPYISFLNLASVREIEKDLGIPIDPRRFRMNVWVEGLDPWVELDIIDAYGTPDAFPMTVGPAKFGIDDLCERCKAVNQNPTSGEVDTNLMFMIDEYLQARGYKGSPHRNKHSVMGWLALPLSNSRIYSGMPVTIG